METKPNFSSEVARALSQSDGSQEAAEAILLKALGRHGMQAMEILSAYEQSDETDLMAPEAELAALEASRQIVRPLLEAKLQRRASSLDATKKKRSVPAAR